MGLVLFVPLLSRFRTHRPSSTPLARRSIILKFIFFAWLCATKDNLVFSFNSRNLGLHDAIPPTSVEL